MFLPFIESGDEPSFPVTINIQANNPFPVGASGGFRENREPVELGTDAAEVIIESALSVSLPDPRTLIRIRPLSTSI